MCILATFCKQTVIVTHECVLLSPFRFYSSRYQWPAPKLFLFFSLQKVRPLKIVQFLSRRYSVNVLSNAIVLWASVFAFSRISFLPPVTVFLTMSNCVVGLKNRSPSVHFLRIVREWPAPWNAASRSRGCARLSAAVASCGTNATSSLNTGEPRRSSFLPALELTRALVRDCCCFYLELLYW